MTETLIGDPRPPGQHGPVGDRRAAGEEGPAGDPRRAGETSAPAPIVDQFDPGSHTVAEVNDHLATADDAERKRVLDVEKAGKNRTSITG